ncbi:hypothetical protein GCM10023195_42530 [Actinoallomurus liliacearum]|uniref:Uncharacterized protein n=1 Tax=Actinoallomurus liliacearum TaxID=1080073 RepID=A0ABP8TMR9_9ACTN
MAALFARLRDATGEDLADFGRVDSGAFDHGALRVGQHRLGFEPGQPAAALADRRAYGFNDDRRAHVASCGDDASPNYNPF